MACEVWLRRDYLLRHGIEPDEPACDHDPEHCPHHIEKERNELQK